MIPLGNTTATSSKPYAPRAKTRSPRTSRRGKQAMKVTRAISTVEVHTGGEPFRIITSGFPRIPGNTILARRKWLGETCDELRRALMFEPRGHADMYGGLLTEPVSEGADFGVIFMHNVGYSSHCGHG